MKPKTRHFPDKNDPVEKPDEWFYPERLEDLMKKLRPKDPGGGRDYIEYMEKSHMNGELIYTVMTVNKVPVARAGVLRHNQKLCDVFVFPKYRNRGYAKKLIAHIMENGSIKPCKLVASPFSDHPLSKEKLMKFYYSLGFSKIIGNEMFLEKEGK